MPSIQAAYDWEVYQCTQNNQNLGYSMDYRNQQTINGITYYDCSSFQWYGLLNGGFDVVNAYRTATGWNYSGNAITTSYMGAFLEALGFVQVSLNGEWKPGDILLRTAPTYNPGHTEMVYEGGTGTGRTMGAHDDSYPAGQQVNVNSWWSNASSYMYLYRYGATPPTPPGPGPGPTPGSRRKMPLMYYLRRIY